MEVDTRKEGEAMVVCLKGKIDAVTAPDVEKKFEAWIAEDEKNFVLDLSGLEYISSAGLRSFLLAARKVKALQGKLLFCGLQGMVKDVFEIAGFSDMFSIFASEEEALKQL
ncbi:MAG: STAS domain-containing protein [bacterium]